MRSLFHDFDTDESGTMDCDELLELFKRCGYTIVSEVIEDAIKVALPLIHNRRNADLVFEDVLKVFYLVRKREGFSEQELNELTDVYNRHDKGGKGELREFELARCFTWMGYPLSQHRRRELWCRVDVDKTESIELGEFLKLVRLLREEEISAARELLASCEHLKGGGSFLPEASLKKMLLQLGYMPSQQLISQAMKQNGDTNGDGSVDLQGVLSILRFIREKQVVKLRQSAGISDQQASKIKGKFGLRVEAGKQIELNEFERIMYDLFPVARHQQGEREKIKNLMLEQTGGNRIKDLMEAYWIVRLYGDMRDEDKWNREQQAASDAGFTNWQVASFREAFVAADGNSDGCLTEREIQAVFEDLMSLNLNQFEAMSREFHNLGDNRDCVEFAEFLRLMKVILVSGQGSG
jgi:Ca2+-binding EF-hand superfamily protein